MASGDQQAGSTKSADEEQADFLSRAQASELKDYIDGSKSGNDRLDRLKGCSCADGTLACSTSANLFCRNCGPSAAATDVGQYHATR